MYFCRNFCVRRDFIYNPNALKKRLMVVGLAMLVLAPFLVIFMLVYLFLRHAEQFYNHPSTASSRRWSNVSRWIFREFNEVQTVSLSLSLSQTLFSNKTFHNQSACF
jgi:autophagy-related protein 9